MNDGAPPRPDPKAVRSTLVDSGWSAIPPAATEVPGVPDLPPPRPLPNYDASESVREVTMVDREINSRAKAMREKDTLPPPRRSGFPPTRSSAFPPSRASAAPPGLPPPPVVRAQEPAVVIHPGEAVSPPAAPPPPVAPRSSVAPPPPSRPAAPPSRPPPPATRPAPPPPPASAADTNPGHQAAAARSAATLVRARPSQNPQALPSFASALKQRVRFAGGEVPLWSLVTPLVLLVALGAAFAAAAVTSAADPGAAQAALKPTPEPSASAAPVLPAPLPPPPVVSASADEKPKPLTLLERVSAGDDAAIKELSAKPLPQLSVEEAIALSLGQSAQDARSARALRDRVDHDPGLIKDPEVLQQLRRNTEDPETARDALAAMANVPGPISADLIYEVWTATASRTTATDLARSLIYSKEVRAKASKALAVALDLRDADTCEKNRDLLATASSDGDRRASHLLNKLTRKYGCGPNKRQDCYACLRDGKALDDAIKAVKARREPHPFGG
ncbi:MAG: hypothetical protein ABUL62_34100 [Myxococcales bacterium]